MHKLILPHEGESEGATSKLDKLVKEMEPGICLDLACGGGEHSCDGRSCVRIQSYQRGDLAAWFGDITEKEKSEVQILAKCVKINVKKFGEDHDVHRNLDLVEYYSRHTKRNGQNIKMCLD